MSLLILTADDMRAAMTMRNALDATSEALRAIVTGSCDVPLRGKVRTPAPDEGTALFMYGSVPAASALGVKLYAEFPGNAARDLPSASAMVVLLDAATGRPEALLDGTYLTQLRTGASSGVATNALAPADASVMALIGAGGQAWSQLEAVLAVRPIREVRVYARHADTAERFIAREGERLAAMAAAGTLPGPSDANAQTRPVPPRLVATASADEAVTGADIVTCVTTASEPVFHAGAVKPGAHVNAVGSYTPEMSELPAGLVAAADNIYMDAEAALEESGDLIKPLASGAWDKVNLAGLIGDVLGGRPLPARDSATATTVYESVGSAALDLVVGQRMVERAREFGLGTVVDF